jgi:hypothetical protein
MKTNKLRNKVGIYGKIIGTEEADNTDGICDYCKCCIIDKKDIPPNL